MANPRRWFDLFVQNCPYREAVEFRFDIEQPCVDMGASKAQTLIGATMHLTQMSCINGTPSIIVGDNFVLCFVK